jgi:hypothetical protein
MPTPDAEGSEATAMAAAPLPRRGAVGAGLGHVARHVLDVISRSSMAILTTGTWATPQ